MAYMSIYAFNKKCAANRAGDTRKVEVKCDNFSFVMSTEEAADLVLQIAQVMQEIGSLSREEMAEGDQTSERC